VHLAVRPDLDQRKWCAGRVEQPSHFRRLADDNRLQCLRFHTFTNYVKVTFFQGTSLRPVPPGGKAKEARWIDVHEDDLDEAQLAAWVRQASALPGWVRCEWTSHPLDAIIFQELVYGRLEETARSYFRAMIGALGARGCDAVILGCTETPALITEADSPLPVIDSTARRHAPPFGRRLE